LHSTPGKAKHSPVMTMHASASGNPQAEPVGQSPSLVHDVVPASAGQGPDSGQKQGAGPVVMGGDEPSGHFATMIAGQPQITPASGGGAQIGQVSQPFASVAVPVDP